MAATMPQAAQAGAAVLARGGNAVDEAVTRSLVAGVVEPWMNGIGVGYAEDGVPVTWHTTLEIARDLVNLTRFPATRTVFCDASGFASFTVDEARPVMLRQTDLGRTLRRLAEEGPRSFYE